MNRSQIKAQYTPRTLLFEFWLNKLGSGKKLLKLQNKSYEVSWSGKMTATQSSTIPLSVERMKEHSFTLFRHVFWKRTIFEGVPALVSLVILVSRVHWGLKNMWKKFREFAKKIDDLRRNFVRPTLSNLPPATAVFQISPLDGGSQHLIHVKHC